MGSHRESNNGRPDYSSNDDVIFVCYFVEIEITGLFTILLYQLGSPKDGLTVVHFFLACYVPTHFLLKKVNVGVSRDVIKFLAILTTST